MFTRMTKQAMLAATALSGIAATPALAQEAGGDAGDIVVTARRVEERLQDVPISITVFNQEQISNRNIVNAGDLGIYTPSLTTNSKFGLEKASFVIRGFVQDSPTQPSVGTYFADVVGPRAAGSTPSGNGVSVGNFFDLQNVQILKGPQGTLFGRNTTGGAVLLVPKKPTGQLEGYVEGSLGNYDMRRGQAVINIPLAETFKVRLGVDRMKRDGYLINRSGVGPDRLANSNFIAARLSIVADLTPDLENYTIASYINSDNNGSVPRIVACNPAITSFYTPCVAQLARASTRGWWEVENNEPNAKIKQETMQVINTTTWRASDSLTIKNIISYAEFRDVSRYSLQGDYFTSPSGALLATAIRTNNTPGYYLAAQSTFTEELQFQGGAPGNAFNWQAGLYIENSDPIGFTSQMSPLATNCQTAYDQLAAGQLAADSIHCSGGSISIPFQKTYFRNRGVYAQATYKLTEQLSLTGGLRYTWDKMTHRYDGTSVAFPTPTTNRYTCSNGVRVRNPDGTFPVVIGSLADHERCKVVFTAKSQKPTWLIDLDYKPNDDVLIYAKWARGFRAGGVAAANITFEAWEPEKVDTYEVGAKTSFRGSSVSGYLNVAGFYNNFTNQQIQAALIRNAATPNNPAVGAAAIVNAGKSRIYGAEVDASVSLFDALKFDLGYTYLNTKVQSIISPVIPPETQAFYSAVVPNTVTGDPLALSPKHRLTATVTYTLPLDDSIGAISFGATWVHTGSQFMTRAVPVNLRKIPTTNLLLLNANWKDVMGAPVDLAFFMTNVTNEKFPLTTTASYASFSLESQLPNEPRMFGFRLRYRFGD